ncbi:MAG: hypothetical protein IJO11_04150 [Alphaproteobacteria bacterium]|nr:hypothetical protein [Alphaproteobacteria bacterium]
MAIGNKSIYMALFFSNFAIPKKWKNGKNNINVHILTIYCNFKPAIKTRYWSNAGLWWLLWWGIFQKNKKFFQRGTSLVPLWASFVFGIGLVLVWFGLCPGIQLGCIIYFLSIPHIISHDPT